MSHSKESVSGLNARQGIARGLISIARAFLWMFGVEKVDFADVILDISPTAKPDVAAEVCKLTLEAHPFDIVYFTNIIDPLPLVGLLAERACYNISENGE